MYSLRKMIEKPRINVLKPITSVQVWNDQMCFQSHHHTNAHNSNRATIFFEQLQKVNILKILLLFLPKEVLFQSMFLNFVFWFRHFSCLFRLFHFWWNRNKCVLKIMIKFSGFWSIFPSHNDMNLCFLPPLLSLFMMLKFITENDWLFIEHALLEVWCYACNFYPWLFYYSDKFHGTPVSRESYLLVLFLIQQSTFQKYVG